MSFTLCTSGAIVIKAGLNVNTLAATSAALLGQFSDEAEGFIAGQTRIDWVVKYASVPTTLQPVLADAAACLAATFLIAYDMGGYTGRGEAEDMININHDRAARAIRQLSDDKTKTMMGVT